MVDKAQYFHANGKLLLTGEYFVLDGAKALATPTKFGQSLFVRPSDQMEISWRSLNYEGEKWFSGRFQIEDLEQIESNHLEIADNLIRLFSEVRKQKPDLFVHGWDFQTRLDFPELWGLGTSSTLITNTARWANIDPYHLLEATFGGSGYDIACAEHHQPIIFKKGIPNIIQELSWKPSFSSHLFFVYLGKKQNSREGIALYKSKGIPPKEILEEVTLITDKIIITKDYNEFRKFLDIHEDLVASYLGLEKVKDKYFSDFSGSTKSLGAWGGDFILVASIWDEDKTKSYFKNLGFETVINWNEMIA